MHSEQTWRRTFPTREEGSFITVELADTTTVDFSPETKPVNQLDDPDALQAVKARFEFVMSRFVGTMIEERKTFSQAFANDLNLAHSGEAGMEFSNTHSIIHEPCCRLSFEQSAVCPRHSV